MSEGIKHDGGKPEMDLIPYEALVEISKVLSFGAKKYGRFNWRKGIEWSRVLSATMRHLHAYNAGENVDPETSISHLAHAACNLMFLLTYANEHPELDDRFKNDKKERTQ